MCERKDADLIADAWRLLEWKITPGMMYEEFKKDPKAQDVASTT